MHNFTDIEFIAWTHCPACQAWVDKKFDYYVLDYAESGGLLMQFDDNPVMRLKGPVAFLTFPGPHIRFGRKHGFWNHRFVSFKGKQAYGFRQNGLFPVKTPIIRITDPERFTRAFDDFLRYISNPEYGISRAAYMLAGLLLQLHEQPPQKVIRHHDSRIIQVIEKISASPERDWGLRKLASQSSFSYPHFRRLFTAAAGMPPGNFIITKRMEKAARLLRQPNPLTLQETASSCGYEDIYYFNKLFRKFHKIPPGRYRDNFQLK